MKKNVCWVLMALLVLSFAIACAESPEGSVYYAIALDDGGTAPQGCVGVALPGMSCWISLPAGSDAKETYFNKGLRVTLSAPIPDEGFPPDAIVTPLAVERVGLIDGEVIELGEDYIVSYIYQLAAVVEDAPQIRIALTDETIIREELTPGDFIEIFYDEETETAFEIWITRG